MMSSFKKLVPVFILDYIRKYRYSPISSKYQDKSIEDTFDLIYKQNVWGSDVSASGQGSTKEQSENVIDFLDKIILEYDIKTIVDLPCGDFNWMKHVNLTSVDYLGGDIVKEIVENNNKCYSSEKVRFMQINLIEDKLPEVDLIIVRDCLVHFSYDDIFKSIENIKSSNSKYLLVTTFAKQTVNHNIITGDWRPVNLLRHPFKFTKPLITVVENFEEEYEQDYRGKSMGLWDISKL